MASRIQSRLLPCLVLLCAPVSTFAQEPAPAPATAPAAQDTQKSQQLRLERISPTHTQLTGKVEIEQRGMKFFADVVDIYTDTNRLTASGNVVFVNPEGRISAERLEFNTKEQTGTFYEASGIMSLGPKAERVQFGGQDPDVYFYGETVEKLGPKKYRLTRGGFTTCVQPTPRWELTSGTVTLNLDDYALLKNTVLRVKGVPVFYLPLGYYPIQEDQRATGFLLPSYGASTLGGQRLSNAFFWAINRSQDATFFHDWYTHTGQGYGTEYRYVAGPQSEGNFLVQRFNQKAAQFDEGNTTTTLPESKSFEVRGNAVQTIARGLRARSRVEYFSELQTKQLYHQNLYDASQRRRIVQAGLTGAWGPYTTSVNYDHSELFDDQTSSVIYGSTPRVNGAIAPTRLFGAPIYASITSEFANLPDRRVQNGVTTRDEGLQRFDMAPLVRVPVSRWTFLTFNTSLGYQLTRFSESLNTEGVQVDVPLTRSYFDFQTEAVGPVFTKIWDAAADSSAERYKHVIEPTFRYQQVSDIGNYQAAPNSSSDFVVSGAGRFTYGLTNRLLRRDRPREGAAGTAREFLAVTLQQTYYSVPEASRHDPNYVSSTSGRQLVDLSPVALSVRYSPTQASSATLKLEHDVSGAGLQSLTASGNVYFGTQSVTASVSRQRLSETSPANVFLSTATNLAFVDGRIRGAYSIYWDIARSYIVSQAINATYFAQCCGFGVEFQNYNYDQISSSPISSDRRFNFSFTLAGLGTFSNFFGAFGGGSTR